MTSPRPDGLKGGLKRGLKRNGLAVAAAVALAGAAFAGWRMSRDESAATPAGLEEYVFWQAKDLAGFSLAAAGNRRLGLADLRGKWSFIFFGYTHCPDVCPLTLSVLGQAFRMLEKDPAMTREIQGIFVSVDPGRDTPESLRDYASHFHPAFLGVTGSSAEVDAVVRQMGASYVLHAKPEGKAGDNYLVTHTATIFLVDPRGRLYGRFPTPHAAQEIAEVFTRIRDLEQKRSARRWVFS